MTLGRDEVGQRSETVRRANLSTILGELHARGPQSRSELVLRTGLTRSAVRGLIGELASAGLVEEGRPAPLGTPGRPSPLVRAAADGPVVLAWEIAVDSVAVAIVGLGGTVLDRVRVDRSRGTTTVDEVVDELVALGRDALDRLPGHVRPIGVGVTVVGVVRRSDGLVSMAPNLGWVDVPLGDRIASAMARIPRLRGLPLAVANDADLGALAELRRGAAVGARDVVFLSSEVGIGGGLIVDGQPLSGTAGYAGEVGHMPINPNGVPCRCGSVGCWETEVGEGALLLRAGHPLGGGRAAVDAVLAEADAGVPTALAALEHVGRWLGIGIAGLVNVFDPERVVLGGLFCRIHPYVRTQVAAELDRRALRAPRALVEVVPARLGEDAHLLGAAELAFEPLLADPAGWIGPRDRSAAALTA